MKNRNWRTTIGGAVSAFGMALMGVGSIIDKDSDNIEVLWWTRFIGFVLSAVGTFFGLLFAADSGQLREIKETQVDQQKQLHQVPAAVESGDTKFLRKSIDETQTKKDT